MNTNEMRKNEIKICAFRQLGEIDPLQVPLLVQSMKKVRPAEMIFVPNFEDPAYCRGLILREYCSSCFLHDELVHSYELVEDIYILKIVKYSVRRFSWQYRREFGLHFYSTSWQEDTNAWGGEWAADKSDTVELDENFILKLEEEIPVENVYEQFVFTTTPAQIERALNERVIGQPQLTRATADFLYYHAMRQINPELPPRPMLIAGPSGTGKTEVWRVAKELYKHIFHIKIIDASRITQEGWKGNDKLSTAIDEAIADGGILIADEFDKLARPQYTGMGENISIHLQSEFLKAVEGELHFSNGATGRNIKEKDTKKMGFVFLGAFAEMFEKKAEKNHKERFTIGFGSSLETSNVMLRENTDQDYLRYGIMAELIGRIAVKICTNDLSDEDYIRIVKNPASRVSQLSRILSEYVDNIPPITETRIKELIAISKDNRTGVRWVCSQIENEILANIHNIGIRKEQSNKVMYQQQTSKMSENGLGKAS